MYMNEWLDESMDRWIDGQLDGWMDEWMNGSFIFNRKNRIEQMKDIDNLIYNRKLDRQFVTKKSSLDNLIYE